jgi:hypothetical protein
MADKVVRKIIFSNLSTRVHQNRVSAAPTFAETALRMAGNAAEHTFFPILCARILATPLYETVLPGSSFG